MGGKLTGEVDEKACKKLTFFRRSEAKSRPIGPRKRAIIDRVRRYARQRHNGVAMISRARGPRRRPCQARLAYHGCAWWWRRRHHHIRLPAGRSFRDRFIQRGHSHWPFGALISLPLVLLV